ncbi:hypothetical protein [Halorientalis halophila]|uniref:hypothetical protein n=1 Tax=Halorientalis halophila TaxID=3108499 RepID=UPI00300BE94B
MLDLLPASFPAETIPDGNVGMPHHLIYPLVAGLVPAFRLWDWYPRREPWLYLSGILAALFGFLAVWPYYPAVGAGLTGAGLLAALAGLCRPVWWEYWPRRHQIVMAALVAAAADDWVSHALGWPTPLDLAFKRWGIEGSALIIVAVAVVGFVLLRFIPERDYPQPVR